jgi:hypothetical protein
MVLYNLEYFLAAGLVSLIFKTPLINKPWNLIGAWDLFRYNTIEKKKYIYIKSDSSKINSHKYMTFVQNDRILRKVVQRLFVCLFVFLLKLSEISVSYGGEYGGSTYLWNVGTLKRDYTTLYPRRLSSSDEGKWNLLYVSYRLLVVSRKQNTKQRRKSCTIVLEYEWDN